MREMTTLCVGLTALMSPTKSFAQETRPQPNAGDRQMLEEIVVTAQKRYENMQTVPVAITAVTGDSLEAQSITSTADLSSVMPGLKQGYSAGTSLFYLRGVGQNTGAPGVVSPISTYLDGVYLGIARLSLFDLNAISQVSLLRGPQGSLFGRNASGGIIQVATKNPDFTFNGSAHAGYANYGTFRGDLYASGPVSENLAANISLRVRNQTEGAITNIFTGSDLLKQKTVSGQTKLLWKPTDRTDVLISGIYYYAKDLPGNVVGWTPGFIAGDGLTTYLGEDKVSNRVDSKNLIRTSMASMKVTHDLGWATIENLAHGVWTDYDFLAQQGGHAGRPNPNNAADLWSTNSSKISAWGNDLEISSPENGSAFKWIAGISYEHERTNSDFAPTLDGVVAARTVSTYISSAWAVFVQGTYAILPETRVTAGARYTTDRLSFDGINLVNGLTTAAAGLPPSSTFNQVTWRASIDHSLTPDILLYVSANRGFKAGQYNVTSVVNPPLKPEIVDAYELGLKSELFDNRVRLNVSTFFQKARNLQLRALRGSTVFLFNAANAEVAGVDLDFRAVVSDHLTLTGGFEWLPRAEYTRFPNASGVLPAPTLTIPSNCTGALNPRIGGTTPVTCDLSGYRMIYSPKISATYGFQYSKDTPIGKISVNVADQYSSRYFVDPNGATSVKPYHVINASVVWTAPNERYDVKLWVTNLAKASVYTNAQFLYVPGEPRRYGIDFGVKF